MPFVVPEVEAQNNSTGSGSDTTPMTVTAYLNGTSPTGRTLDIMDDYIHNGLVLVISGQGINEHVFLGWHDTSDWQIPIPESWPSGTYELNLEVLYNYGTNSYTSACQQACSGTVTIPELPAEPTMTATAYLNDTSSTGRTLQLDNFNQYQETHSCNYCLVTINVQGVDVWYYIKDAVSRWQLSIPESWQPGTYTVNISENYCSYNISTNHITCPNLDFAAASDTITVPELPAEPTMTATAYLNGTSPTGRTLDIMDDYIHNGLTLVINGQGINEEYRWNSHCCASEAGWQLSIPESWLSGSYTLNFEPYHIPEDNYYSNPCEQYCSGTVTVPELPATADTTLPVVTVPSNQSFSTTNSTGVMYYIFADAYKTPTIKATDNYNSNPHSILSEALSCIRSDGVSSPSADASVSDAEWYHYPVGTTTVTCTATDSAGSVGTASFTVTVTLEGEETEEEIVIPSWIKNNAGWWADDLIDDRNFVGGIQWLITNGIMVIG